MGHYMLYYRSLPVARIDDVHEHDWTWHGDVTLSIHPQDGDVERRVIQFVDFCKDWHGRMGGPDEPDADEFDAYPEMIGPGVWSTVDESGRQEPITDAPFFYEDGTITWRNLNEAA